MKTVIINENDSGQRVDKFLSKYLPSLPKSMLYKLLRKKRVKRNRKALGPQDILACGDELFLYINDEFFSFSKPIQATESDFSPLFEDENILVADKPAGQKAHGDGDSLLNQIQGYLIRTGAYDPEKEHSFTPALSNRIDRNTRGLVLAAKNAPAQRMLNEKIKQGEIIKEYLCLATGVFKKEKETLTHFLLIHDGENKVSVCSPDTTGAKEARLIYEVLEQKEDFALLRITLLTGRKHQIRVQLSDIGHPLLGDTKYGAKKDSRIRYQALCAYRLTFAFEDDAPPLGALQGKIVSLKEQDIFAEFLSE